uniref:Uncharacterized protein n=1 Tax=Rhipicephalus zambeziensis TaxID=60191 RepID=A0A224Y542_9ACAR
MPSPSLLRRRIKRPHENLEPAETDVLTPVTSLLHHVFAKFFRQHVHIAKKSIFLLITIFGSRGCLLALDKSSGYSYYTSIYSISIDLCIFRKCSYIEIVIFFPLRVPKQR